jgi:hypothetical protein
MRSLLLLRLSENQQREVRWFLVSMDALRRAVSVLTLDVKLSPLVRTTVKHLQRSIPL